MAGECQGRRSPPAGAGRPTGTLSLLVGLAESFSSSLAPADDSSSRSPTARSPRSFDFEGAVGLGIVAAMNVASGNDAQAGGSAIARTTPRAVVPRRSQPIPIVSARPEGWQRKERRLEEDEDEDMELSESYTSATAIPGAAARGCSSIRRRLSSFPPPTTSSATASAAAKTSTALTSSCTDVWGCGLLWTDRISYRPEYPLQMVCKGFCSV